MISDSQYATLKKQYRLTQKIEPLVDVILEVVDRATRPGRLPGALAEGRAWNADSRANAAQGWIEARLLRRRDLMSAFDFASRPGPFYSSLERSFRHYLMNAEPTTEVQNLVGRANDLMRSSADFDQWPFGGRSWWGLAQWRTGDEDPPTWNSSPDDLVAAAWGCGEFTILRYGPTVGRASPILERSELERFLRALFEATGSLLENAHLRTVFERRFGAGSAVGSVEFVDADAPVVEAERTLEDQEIEACAATLLEEITARQAEVLRRKRAEQTLDEIAAALGVARGTVDNELGRVGEAAKRLAGDMDAERVLESLFDILSIDTK